MDSISLLNKVQRIARQLLRPDIRYRLIKYVISGSISATVTLSVLYAMTQWFGIWYLFSSTVGFFVGFFVSFMLQKFWTFRNTRMDIIVAQAFLYFFILVGNLGVNALGMYLLVDILNVGYIFAEILVLALVASESFFLYMLVFKKQATDS